MSKVFFFDQINISDTILNHLNKIKGLALYYQFHQTPQLSAIRETIKKFEEIECLFERQKTYHFYSSSLIVTYEAYLEDNLIAQTNNITSNNTKSFENSVRIVMADFAHV